MELPDVVENALVRMKDQLWSDVRDADERAEKAHDIGTAVSRIEGVLTILEAVENLWAACEYAYKGQEIAGQCIRKLSILADAAHNMPEKKLRIDAAWKLARDLSASYYRREQDRLTPV